MSLTPAALGAYLHRIGLADTVQAKPMRDRLEALVTAHAASVPFENLDILLGRGISLDPETVFDKIVNRRRGGYCFEQNGLFARVLAAHGFTVRPTLARVWLNPTDGVPPRTHVLLLVMLDGAEHLVDVGFGGGRVPVLRLGDKAPQQGVPFRFRLIADPVFGWMLQGDGGGVQPPGAWRDLYSFSGATAEAHEIEAANHYTSTTPGARFTSLRVVSLGGAALTDHNFTLRTIEGTTEQIVAPGETYLALLRDRFGIDIAAPYTALFAEQSASGGQG